MSRLRQFLINRNPRNLEKLSIAWRPTGYHFEKNRDFREYYYQVEFEKSNNHTSAFVKHMKDGRVLQASTMEFAIASRLHSNVDVSAAYNIGRILARRCLQSGIYFVHRGLKEGELKSSERMQAFCRGVEEEGVALKELPMIKRDYKADPAYHQEYPSIDESKEFKIPPADQK